MIVHELSRFHRKYYKSFYFAVAIAVFFMVCFAHRLWYRPEIRFPIVHYYAYQDNDVSCQTFTKKDWRDMPITNKTQPPSSSDKIIYFHETSCKGGLNSREACAIESAAKAHHDWTIRVYFFGPVHKLFLEGNLYRTLKALPNVFLSRIHLESYVEGTILESFYSSARITRILLKSGQKVKSLFELLKFLTLYLHGGVFLDLDMIVVNSFNGLPKNWAARQSATEVGAGVISFSSDKIGRGVANEIMRQMYMKGYLLTEPDSSSELLTQMLKTSCLTKNVTAMNAANCLGFDIFDKIYFYPTDNQNWGEYYMPKNILSLLDTYTAFTHKTWGSLSSGYIFDSNSKLAKLAQLYCPKVYKLYGEDFGL